MIAKTYADNNGPTYTYNADGQLLTRTWSRGITTTYAYDTAGRQTGYSYSDGVTPSVSMTLNYLDQTTAITDAAGTRNFSYNSNYRLANETNPVIVNGVMNYTYDAYGRRTGMNLTDGTVRAQAGYTYDTAGRIGTVGNSVDTLTYTYRPGMTQVASAAWANATALPTMYTYDQYHRLTGIAVNNQPVYGYTLNDKNQRTEATLGNGDTWEYTYDTLGQLTGAVKKDAQDTPLNTMNYVYDLIGNRTTATEDANTFNYTNNLVNQYIQINQSIPTYDTDCNMLTYNGWTFTYNGENRMVLAENTSTGARVEAAYDYKGRRIFKKVYDNSVLDKHIKFVYDSYNLIAEFDALNSDAQTASYLWHPVGLDTPLMRRANNCNEYYVIDGNKNVIELRNASGTKTDSYIYDPFGKVTHDGSSSNPFRFSSEFYDAETLSVYYNYRDYIPAIGRWRTKDPIEEQGGVNLYGMINNNTIYYIDILGLLTLDEIEKKYRDMIAAARKKGKDVAADNLEHFLGASGRTRILDWAWLRTFSVVTSAEKENIKRFEKSLKAKAATLSKGEQLSFYDYWDRTGTASVFEELYYASGTFTITSYGQFSLTRNNNCVSIIGNVDHYWWDPYDWHAGLGAYIPGFGDVSDADALALENAGRAKPFLMESEWFQKGNGRYIIRGLLPNSLNMSWSEPKGGSSGAHDVVVQQIGQKAVRPPIK